MGETIKICTECHSSNVDGWFDWDCPGGGSHLMVDAVVTDCPYTRLDKRGSFRAQWRKEADRRCRDDTHHYRISAHVTLPLDLTKL